MFKPILALGIAAFATACSKPTLKDALAQCVVEANRTTGAVSDNDAYIADCMDGHGYAVRERECAKVTSPARVEACYRAKSGS